MATNNWKEKRQFVRASFGWPAALINGQGEKIHGRVRDISSGGALIHIKTQLEVNDQVELAIDIPDFKDVISATGIVVRVNILDEETSSPTYALGVSFNKMSSSGLKYFSGTLPSGWRKPLTEKKDRQETPNISDQGRGNPESSSKVLQWVAGGSAAAVLLLTAIVFFQLVFQNSPVIQEDFLLLSEGISKELLSLQEVSRQQTSTIMQIENRLAGIEKSSISSEQIEKILSLLDSQIQDLQQIKSGLQNTPETGKESSYKEVVAYHTVRSGETIFSISRQHGLTVDELLSYNDLSKGTIIFSNQKLRITSNSSNM